MLSLTVLGSRYVFEFFWGFLKKSSYLSPCYDHVNCHECWGIRNTTFNELFALVSSFLRLKFRTCQKRTHTTGCILPTTNSLDNLYTCNVSYGLSLTSKIFKICLFDFVDCQEFNNLTFYFNSR